MTRAPGDPAFRRPPPPRGTAAATLPAEEEALAEPTTRNRVRAAYRLSPEGVTESAPGGYETTSDAPLPRARSLVHVDLPLEVLERLESSDGTAS